MILEFQHKQSAHCENGVTSNLLRHYGFDLSEPLVYGIGSGLFFAHMPFVKVNAIPVTSFRPFPGIIFSRVTRQLGITIRKKKFKNPSKAMDELDALISKGIPAGLLVGVYHLTYFPRPYRFHFNAHNIVVYGRENGSYVVSDPIMETPEFLTYNDLKRVRFARGLFAPHGHMYYATGLPEKIDLKLAVLNGIKKTCQDMLTIPVPMFGVKGIRYMSRKISNYPKKPGPEKASLYLGQIIRAQEEIGTGGAGFRFIYAAFLQQASEITGNETLMRLSEDMTRVGDLWRSFAVDASRIVKNRSGDHGSYPDVASILMDIAEEEETIYKKLKRAIS